MRTAVYGASGYAGGELVRILDAHPLFEITALAAHTSAGKQLRDVHPNLSGLDRPLVAFDEVAEIDLAFLALPHGASVELGRELAGANTLVVDLGSDWRLDSDARYRDAYGTAHPFADELGDWAYGLPELFDLSTARRIAAPGCYPTSALLALAPAIRAGLLVEDIVITAISGVTGAGRGVQRQLSFGAIAEGVRPYAVGTHRHRPEIEMVLETSVSFTPHLAPIQRGLVSTSVAGLTAGSTVTDVREALDKHYSSSRFVEVIDEPPQTRWVVGSNRCLISVHADRERVVIVSAIDNLVKGAAGQAVQAANIACGLDEALGLSVTGLLP